MKRTLVVLLALLAIITVGLSALAADPEERDQQKSQTSASNLNQNLNVNVASTPTPEVEKLGDDQAVRAKDDGKPRPGNTIKRRGRQTRRGENAARTGEREDGDGSEKVAICHKPGTVAEKTLLLPEPAIPDHLGHGDELGECDGDITPTAP